MTVGIQQLVTLGQPSDFVGMQLVPYSIRQLLAAAATTPGVADAKASSLTSSEQECFRRLLRELQTGGANATSLKDTWTGAAPNKQFNQQQHQPQYQQQQQQQYEQHQYQQQHQMQYAQQQQQQQMQYAQAQQQQYQQSPVAANAHAPRGKQTKTYARCDLGRAQAVFDPLVDRAMLSHGEAAGRDGVARGLRELYNKLKDGELEGAVENDLAQLVSAIESRDLALAGRMRDKIVRTTTTGWVQGGTWQWALKHLIAAAR